MVHLQHSTAQQAQHKGYNEHAAGHSTAMQAVCKQQFNPSERFKLLANASIQHAMPSDVVQSRDIYQAHAVMPCAECAHEHHQPKFADPGDCTARLSDHCHTQMPSTTPSCLKEACTVAVQALLWYDGCTTGVLRQPTANIQHHAVQDQPNLGGFRDSNGHTDIG